MLIAYGTGAVVAVLMGIHDVLTVDDYLGLHLINNTVMWGFQIAGLALLLRGRDQAAGNLIVPITLVFSVASLTDVAAGIPEGFYSGWARWFPVFIVASMLFARPLTAAILTFWSILWNGLYFVLFCADLPEPLRSTVVGEVIEVSVVDGFIGALAIAGMVMVSSSARTAQNELERNVALNAELERRVADRTRALGSRLAERQAILQNLTDGLLVIGPDGNTVDVTNPIFRELYRLDADVVGQPAANALPQDLLDALKKAWSDDEESFVRREVVLPGNRVGEVAATRVRAEDGHGVGVVAVLRDVTLQREVDRMKTDFISMTSHELRTPLTSVLGFAKIIKGKLNKGIVPALPAEDPRAQRTAGQVLGNIDIIISEGERLTALINDVLDISKMEAGRMEYRKEPVQVSDLCQQSAAAVSALFDGGAVPLHVTVAEGGQAVMGDRHRLVQVLVNFLSNAHKFTEQGSVTLSADPVVGGVRFAVVDTGAGIAPADQLAVFEKFKQASDVLTGKPKGTGLGLSICVQIVRAHDSEIALESAVGEGSRFSFVIAAAGRQ